MVGGVTGVVGAAGGLGGFVPPLLLGVLYGRIGSYGLGLALLAVVALAAAVFTARVVRRPVAARGERQRSPGERTTAMGTTAAATGPAGHGHPQALLRLGSCFRRGERCPTDLRLAAPDRRPRRRTPSTATAGATTRSCAPRTA